MKRENAFILNQKFVLFLLPKPLRFLSYPFSCLHSCCNNYIPVSGTVKFGPGDRSLIVSEQLSLPVSRMLVKDTDSWVKDKRQCIVHSNSMTQSISVVVLLP